jgi:hypothetical protein
MVLLKENSVKKIEVKDKKNGSLKGCHFFAFQRSVIDLLGR